jgi:hypothetical protein
LLNFKAFAAKLISKGQHSTAKTKLVASLRMVLVSRQVWKSEAVDFLSIGRSSTAFICHRELHSQDSPDNSNLAAASACVDSDVSILGRVTEAVPSIPLAAASSLILQTVQHSRRVDSARVVSTSFLDAVLHLIALLKS